MPNPDLPTTTYRFHAHAVPEAIGWSRSFTSALGSALGIGADQVADLKLAVSELVSETVVTDPGEPFSIEGRLEAGQLVLQITPWRGIEPEGRHLAAWDIVSSLFELQRTATTVSLRVDSPQS